MRFAPSTPRGPRARPWSAPLRVVVLALVGWAPLAAQEGEPLPWSQRREEIRELDLESLEDVELEDMLIELTQLVRPEDPLAAFDAARAGYVLGARMRDRGEFADARTVLEDVLALCPPVGGMRPYVLHLLGDLVLYSRDFEGALRLVEEGREALDEGQSAGEMACSLLCLEAEVHLQMGVPDRAAGPIFEAIQRAEDLREAGASHKGALMDAYLKRANLRMNTGAHALLRDEVRAVLDDQELVAGRPDVVARLVLRLGIAQLWFARGDDEAAGLARGHLEQALANASLLELDRLTCLVRLGQLELMVGDLEAAGGHLLQARSVLERMAERRDFRFAPIERAFLAALESRWSRRARPDELVLLRERRDRLWVEFDGLVAGWRDRPSRAGGVGLLRSDRAQLVLGEMVEAELGLSEQPAAIDALLEVLARAHAAGTVAETLGAEGVPAATIRAALVPPDGGLLVYVPAPEHSHVLAIDEEGSLHARLDDVRELRKACSELDLLVRRSPASYPDSAGRRRRSEDLISRSEVLAESLWPDEIGQRLASWDAVTFVAADLVGELPLEVLPLGEGRALGVALAVDHAPGLAAGVALARRAPRSRGEQDFEFDLMLVAGATPGDVLLDRFGAFETLPVEQGGVDSWVRDFDPARVLRLFGPSASVPALLAAEPQRARSLQVVTHGLRDPALEVSAGLLFSEDGEHVGGFFREDVLALSSSPLVVLAACGAGRGPERSGSDAVAAHLGGAFFGAGADVVVLSSSDMAYRATAVQLRHLNAALARGLTPAEALRSSRAALVAGGEFDDPFYYGQAQAIGLGHRALFPVKAQEELAAEEGLGGHLMAVVASVLLSGAALFVLALRRKDPLPADRA